MSKTRLQLAELRLQEIAHLLNDLGIRRAYPGRHGMWLFQAIAGRTADLGYDILDT